MKRKTWLIFLLIFISLISCSNKESIKEKNFKMDSLNICIANEINSLDPVKTTNFDEISISKHLFEPLIYLDENGNIDKNKSLAYTFEKISDSKYKIKLKNNIKFHNGENLKSQDVVFSIKRACESEKYSHILDNILSNSIEVENENTFTILLQNPDNNFQEFLSLPFLSIINEAGFKEGKLYGTGPFKYNLNNNNLSFDFFEDYWGHIPSFKKLNFSVEKNEKNRLSQLNSNQFQIITSIPSENSNLQKKGFTFFEMLTNEIFYLGVNNKKAPFDNIIVRKALKFAVSNLDKDFEKIPFLDEKLESIIPKNMNFSLVLSEENSSEPKLKAKSLLKEAGYEHGFSFKLAYLKNEYSDKISNIIADELNLLGIKVKLIPLSEAEFEKYLKKGEYDAFLKNLKYFSKNPYMGLTFGFFSQNAGKFENYINYSDEETDDLILNLKTSADEKTFKSIQQKIWENEPFIMKNSYKYTMYIKDNLTLPQINSSGYISYLDIK